MKNILRTSLLKELTVSRNNKDDGIQKRVDCFPKQGRYCAPHYAYCFHSKELPVIARTILRTSLSISLKRVDKKNEWESVKENRRFYWLSFVQVSLTVFCK